MARPRPWPAPVTRTTRSVSCRSMALRTVRAAFGAFVSLWEDLDQRRRIRSVGRAARRGLQTGEGEWHASDLTGSPGPDCAPWRPLSWSPASPRRWPSNPPPGRRRGDLRAVRRRPAAAPDGHLEPDDLAADVVVESSPGPGQHLDQEQAPAAVGADVEG